MAITSPIVTRGFGPNIDGGMIVTMGFGGFIAAVKEVAEDIIRAAGKAARRIIPDVLYSIKASLIEVNGEELSYPIVGSVSKLARVDESPLKGVITFVSSSVRQVSKPILIEARPLFIKYFRPGTKD